MARQYLFVDLEALLQMFTPLTATKAKAIYAALGIPPPETSAYLGQFPMAPPSHQLEEQQEAQAKQTRSSLPATIPGAANVLPRCSQCGAELVLGQEPARRNA